MEGHAPILAVLVPSVVRVQIDGAEQAIAVKGGTFSLEKNSVTVLAERPHKLDEIDVDSLREQLTVLRATEPLTAAISEEIAYLELLCRVKENHA
jgi:F0F1-type ATP synthase epsilon subunit